ncbi:uncharacterized protein LOC135943662 [Cloeon dipterum]|uniref:uncharacterized protein LOC135943662 n=1 Tax=Cloeon dipterum TaxID=197152 RepID=UPI00321FE121
MVWSRRRKGTEHTRFRKGGCQPAYTLAAAPAFRTFLAMASTKLQLALLGVLLSLHLSAGRIISFHEPTSLPSPRDFRIIVADGSSPMFAALHAGAAAPIEPAPVREEQNDIPPPPRVLPPAPPAAPQPQMVNPPAFAADAAAVFGIPPPASGPLSLSPAPVTQAPVNPATPTAVPGVVQVVNSVIPNGGRRIVEPPPAIVPPPDAVNFVPLREQYQQLLAQGINLDQYPATGVPFRSAAPSISSPSRPQQQNYASNFATFFNGLPAEGSPSPVRSIATEAPLVAASPLSRQTSVFGSAAELSNAASGSLQITHHPGHGEAGGTSYSSSSFTTQV